MLWKIGSGGGPIRPDGEIQEMFREARRFRLLSGFLELRDLLRRQLVMEIELDLRAALSSWFVFDFRSHRFVRCCDLGHLLSHFVTSATINLRFGNFCPNYELA